MRDAHRIIFLYLGRRGLSRFALNLGRAAAYCPLIDPRIAISRENEAFAAFAELGRLVIPLDVFRTNAGALTQVWRIPALQRRLAECISRDGIDAVIELMPHVWSPFISSAVRKVGARYACIVHDAAGHPGDRTAGTMPLSYSALPKADRVLTLSHHVADRLQASRHGSGNRIDRLFFPDIEYDPPKATEAASAGGLRLLFLGRILPYKGLDVFVEAIEILRAEGVGGIEVGVFGEGRLGANVGRLARLGAEVVNRWLTDAEVAAVLSRFDAVVAPHVEASQSGVIGAALGAGLPVVATPVGGLVEQITDGVTGLVAARPGDARSLADAIRRLLEPGLYATLCNNIQRTRPQRSMTRFVLECATAVRDGHQYGYDAMDMRGWPRACEGVS